MTKTVHYILEIQPSSLVGIFRSDGAPLTPAPIEKLGTALAPHWFSTQDVIEILGSLRETGRAEKTIQLVGRGLMQMC